MYESLMCRFNDQKNQKNLSIQAEILYGRFLKVSNNRAWPSKPFRLTRMTVPYQDSKILNMPIRLFVYSGLMITQSEQM